MKLAYYNEFDKYAAEWLRNLIAAGHIAPGDVDDRSIEDVRPSDLDGYAQCHFFAGVGVWSYALRLAGWPDDRPVWTGSCPCQPFSAAGQGAGFDDERHLWPAFHHLIRERRPTEILGEQVASKDADPWIDLVCTDMEAMGYSFGAVPFPSAGIGAPHIRDRLYWAARVGNRRRVGASGAAKSMADPSGARLPNSKLEDVSGTGWRQEGRAAEQRGSAFAIGVANPADQRQHGRGAGEASDGGDSTRQQSERFCDAGGVGRADRIGAGRDGRPVSGQVAGQDGQHIPIDADASGGDGWMADTQHDGCGGQESHQAKPNGNRENFGLLDRGHFAPQGQPATGPTNGYWRDADWLYCRDGKWRPVEPGTFPLANGAPARVGRLRAYGNAINAEAARVFIEAVMECAP